MQDCAYQCSPSFVGGSDKTKSSRQVRARARRTSSSSLARSHSTNKIDSSARQGQGLCEIPIQLGRHRRLDLRLPVLASVDVVTPWCLSSHPSHTLARLYLSVGPFLPWEVQGFGLTHALYCTLYSTALLLSSLISEFGPSPTSSIPSAQGIRQRLLLKNNSAFWFPQLSAPSDLPSHHTRLSRVPSSNLAIV